MALPGGRIIDRQGTIGMRILKKAKDGHEKILNSLYLFSVNCKENRIGLNLFALRLLKMGSSGSALLRAISGNFT